MYKDKKENKCMKVNVKEKCKNRGKQREKKPRVAQESASTRGSIRA